MDDATPKPSAEEGLTEILARIFAKPSPPPDCGADEDEGDEENDAECEDGGPVYSEIDRRFMSRREYDDLYGTACPDGE